MVNFHIIIDGVPVCQSMDKLMDALSANFKRTDDVGFMPRCGYAFMPEATLDAAKTKALFRDNDVNAVVGIAPGHCPAGAREDAYDEGE